VAKEYQAAFVRKTYIAAERKMQGDLIGARKLLEEVIEDARRHLGDESPFTLVAIRNLSEVLRAQGDLRRARKLLEDALAVCRRTLSQENEVTVAAMGSLGGLLREQGDLIGARKLQEDVLTINRQVRGNNGTLPLTAMDELAETLVLQGELARARELREEVVKGRCRAQGPEHLETLKAILNLAATAYAQGDFAQARELDEQVLPTYRRLLGEEHPFTLRAMDNLAAAMHSQRDLAGARRLQEHVLAAFRRVLGEGHRDTLLAMNNLAVTMADQADLLGARILEERVLDISRRVMGPEHYDTLRAKHNLTSILKSHGIGTATGRRCVHCLENLEHETADHIIPRSWYPDGTPDSVQRWTVPSCSRCNKRLGAAEKELMVTIALCDMGVDAEASGVPSRALRAIGFGTSGLSEKEETHRKKYRRKVLSRVVPLGVLKDVVPMFPGPEQLGRPRDNMEPVVVLTMDLVAPVAEKIVRGLEFKLAGRYIEPPLSLKTFVVPPERAHELDYIFEGTTELEFGPGFGVLRAVPRDNEIIAMYRIIIWKALTIHVAVGRASN
jgi:tetratricopeptide (TPR) repeat protein